MVIFWQVLGPLQEGTHSVAESDIYSKGVEMLRKTNLESLRQKMKDSLLDNKSNTHEAIEQAQTTLEEAKAANKRSQEQGTAQPIPLFGRRSSSIRWSGIF